MLYSVSVRTPNPTLADIRGMLRNAGAKNRIPSVVTTRAMGKADQMYRKITNFGVVILNSV